MKEVTVSVIVIVTVTVTVKVFIFFFLLRFGFLWLKMTELMRAIIYDMLFFARTVTVVRVRGLLTVIVKVFFSVGNLYLVMS